MNNTPYPTVIPSYNQTTVLVNDPNMVNWLCIEKMENIKLQNRLRNSLLKEETLQRCWEGGNRLFTATASGRPVPITAFTFEEVLYVESDPIYFQQAMYIVRLSTNDAVLTLSEKEYFDDKRFLAKLQNFSKTQIMTYKSAKHVSALLRAEMARKLEVGRVTFFGGWIKEGRDWRFRCSDSFSTHAVGNSTVHWQPIREVGPAAASVAIQAFIESFEPIRDPDLCSMVFLLMHTAFLKTLISASGFDCPQAVCFHCQDPVTKNRLEMLLSFYGDNAVDLDNAPDLFRRELAERKDQPLLVMDHHSGETAKKNADILLATLETGAVMLKQKRDELIQEIQALPVILTDALSVVSCSPICLLWPVSDGDVDAEQCSARIAPFNAEYWTVFARFTEDHLKFLEEDLKDGMDCARLAVGEYELTEAGMKTVGVLMGIKFFMNRFANEVGIDFASLLSKTWDERILRMIEESAMWHTTSAGVADIFIEVAKEMLIKNVFPSFPKGKTAIFSIVGGAIYYDDEYIYMDRSAFDRVCQRCACSRPYVEKALAQAGYLSGKPANHLTYLTRVRNHNAFGIAETAYVFKFKRELFDEFGDQLTFEGEE